MKRFCFFTIAILMLLPLHWATSQQAKIDTGTNIGVKEVKLAIPLFPSTSGVDKSAQLTQVFNQVLWDDLDYTGNLNLVARSFYPLGNFAGPGDIRV